MPIVVSYLEAEQVVECTYSGEVGPAELAQSILSAVELGRSRGTFNVITDLTALAAGPSVGDLYEVPRLFERLGLPRTLREAIVAPALSTFAADVQFYEDVCSNRGWMVRVFPDRTGALAWLAKDPA